MKKKVLVGVVVLAIAVTVIGGGFGLFSLIDPPGATLLLGL